MKSFRFASLFVILLVIGSDARCQPPSSPALKPLAFLSGRWISEKGAEFQEENWLPASGESIDGSFRVVESGKPVFYEFWAVEVEDSRPILKLKHFNFNLVGWEEKSLSIRMPVVSSAANDAIFAEEDGSVSLHYHRTGDTLTCTVHHVKNGKASDEIFNLKRSPAQ